MKKYILLFLASSTLFATNEIEKGIDKAFSNFTGQYAEAVIQRDRTKGQTAKSEEKTGSTSTKKETAQGEAVAGSPEKKIEKVIKLEKKSYCTSPIGRHQFYEMNSKGEYRADIKFKLCVINDEKIENMIVGIIATDLNGMREYVKTYEFLHFKEGERLRQNADGKNYYYDSVWSWSSTAEYPASLLK